MHFHHSSPQPKQPSGTHRALLLACLGAAGLAYGEETALPGLEPDATPAPTSGGAIPVQPFQVDNGQTVPLPVPAEPPKASGDPDTIEKELENPLFGKPDANPEDVQTKPIDRAAIRAMAAKYLMPEPLVGPFGLGGVFTGFRSGVVFTGMYDSNILQAAPSVSEDLYGRSPESFILAAGPFLRYRSPGPLWYAEVAYSPSYVSYLDFDEFSGWDQNGAVSLRYDHREWDAELSGYYRTTRGTSSSLATNSQQQAVGGAASGSSNLDREGLGGEDYGANFRVSFQGRKLQSTLGGGYGRSSGQNRYYYGDVDEEQANANFMARYQFSPKTAVSLTSGINYRGPLDNAATTDETEKPTPEPVQPVQPVDPTQPVTPVTPVAPVAEEPTEVKPAYEETIAANLALAALWKATPLIELGPGVRATYDARGSDLSTTSIGPLLRARYQLSKRVNITGQVAAEFHSFDVTQPKPAPEPTPTPAPVVEAPVVTAPVDPNNPTPTPEPVVVTPVVAPTPEPDPVTPAVYDNGEDPFIAAELGMAWSPTEQWTLSLLAARTSRASPNQNEDFQQVLSARAAVSRKFDYLVITAGAGYESETPMRQQIAGTPVTTNLDRDYLTADLSVSFPIWKDKAFATTFVRYRDQQSGNTTNTWDGYQAGIAVGVSF